MTSSLKVVAKYGTPEEAHLIRNRLEAAGIPAFLDGEMTAGWAWHFANAMGGVKVLVPEEHARAAEAVLAPGDEQRTAGAVAQAGGPPVAESRFAEEELSASWRCGNCRAEVDSAMDVCWACGTVREETEPSAWEPEDETPPPTEPEERGPVAPVVALFVVLFPPTFAYFLFSKLCQLLAPWVPDARHHPPPESPESPGLEEAGVREPGQAAAEGSTQQPPFGEEALAPGELELDALVLRAWRAALMGFFLLPPLLMTLYSTWLLMEYWSRRRRPHRERDRCARWTLVVNLVAALCLGFFVASAVAGFYQSLYDGLRHAPGVMRAAREERALYLGH
ncbi:MAG TPA: DUF2007 domain-containing protein [Thermoguttaceae bacterium]|nr:DUF2007 domain-containing protein [Thermoguttaceae bacterium]